MPARRSPATGGRGSNQYVTRGSSSAAGQARAAGRSIADALDNEAVAAAFGTDDDIPDLNDTATVPDMVRIAVGGSIEQRKLLAARKDTPAEILERLAADPEWEVRAEVARNPAASLGTLQGMTSDPQIWVRCNLADTADVRVLPHLADDPLARVRSTIAYRQDCPPNVLTRLADDETALVRNSVARNPNTPHAALNVLADDTDPNVSEYARRNRDSRPVSPTRVPHPI